MESESGSLRLACGGLLLLHAFGQIGVTLWGWPSLSIEVQLYSGLKFHIASLEHTKVLFNKSRQDAQDAQNKQYVETVPQEGPLLSSRRSLSGK